MSEGFEALGCFDQSFLLLRGSGQCADLQGEAVPCGSGQGWSPELPSWALAPGVSTEGASAPPRREMISGSQ